MMRTAPALPAALALSLALAGGCASTRPEEGRQTFDVFLQDEERIDRIFRRASKSGPPDVTELVPDLLDLPRPPREELLEVIEAFDELRDALPPVVGQEEGTDAAAAQPPPEGPALGPVAFGTSISATAAASPVAGPQGAVVARPRAGGTVGGTAGAGGNLVSSGAGISLFGLGLLQTFPAVPGGSSASQLVAGKPQCLTTFCAGLGKRTLDLASLERRPGCSILRTLSGRSHPPAAGFMRIRKSCLGLGILLRLAFRRQYHAHIFEDTVPPPATDPPLDVKALVLRDQSGKTFYWVSADLVGAFQDLRTAVLAKLHTAGIDDVGEENFLLHGSHTHSGPGALSPRWLPWVATVDLWVRPLFELVADLIVEAIEEARDDLDTAELGTGTALLHHVTENRRDVCPGDPPNTPPDPTVGIISVVRPGGGGPVATVVNFAVHPTSLGAGNLTLHPDNVGYAERYIEDATHWGGTTLFFNGTEGDVRPIGYAADVGGALGATVVNALPSIPTTADVTLSSSFCHLNDPPDPRYSPACPRKLDRIQIRPKLALERSSAPGCYVGDGTDNRVVVTIDKEDDEPWMDRQGAVLAAYRIDHSAGFAPTNTVLVTLPGEPITDIGAEIRNAISPLAYENVWIFGLSNAHLGYIVTDDEYRQGGYESVANFFGPTEGEVFTAIADHLVRQLPAPP